MAAFVRLGVMLVLLLLSWKTDISDAQTPCLRDIPSIEQPFKETDLPGHLLLNLTVGDQLEEAWGFRVKHPTGQLDPYFTLTQDGSTIRLTIAKVFDLEEVYSLVANKTVSYIEFALQCHTPLSQDIDFSVYASVLPVNEFSPQFINLPAKGFDILETANVNSTLMVLKDYVIDRDVETNPPGFNFSLLPTIDPTLNGRRKMEFSDSMSGSVYLREGFDYEAMDPTKAYYILNVTVGDRQGLTSSGTVRINVIDDDDLPPEFFYPGCLGNPCYTAYTAAIRDDFQGKITWLEPAPIAARDRDTLGSPVTFSFKQGEPDDYAQYIGIDHLTGVPILLKTVAYSNVTSFRIIVEALEQTALQHSAQTVLWLTVVGRNETVPTLPPVVVEIPASGSSMFRVATIVLGVLLGLILFILVVFVLCSMGSKIKATPVMPSAFKPSFEYRLSGGEPGTSSTDDTVSEAGRDDGRANSRKTSADTGIQPFFTSACSSPFNNNSETITAAAATADTHASAVPESSAHLATVPTTYTYYEDEDGTRSNAAATIFRKGFILDEPEVEEQEVSFDVCDLDDLAGREEIEYNETGPGSEPYSRSSSRLSTISGSERSPHTHHDWQQLVGTGVADLGETIGMSNPVYDDVRNDRYDEVGVLPPLEEAPIMV